MVGEHAGDYLAGLSPERAAALARVNRPGLAALRTYLDSGDAVAFLGAGVSAPLYPLWDGLICELVDAAAGRLEEREAETCRALARDSPEEVVEIVRERLGAGSYREVLRGVLRARVDPESGRSWTPVQELVCRCAFKAVVTTNYDPGVVDARIRVRPGALSTGFITWEDELGLDLWRTGDVFGEAELPVLFAHGQHNRPDSIVLATTEYRRAYAGKLPQVLARLMDGHLVWAGFSFADQRIAAILREIADHTGTRIDPGGAPRHVAVMAWDPDAGASDPGVLARRTEIAYGAQVVLYPAPGGDHSALGRLLSTLADPRFPPAEEPPAHDGAHARISAPTAEPGLAVAGSGAARIPVKWVPEPEPVAHFTGRAEELARLDRWAADPEVVLVGVTAWGGAGKTALVTHWIRKAGAASRRPGIRGVFGWSFYADPSVDHWAQAMLDWVQENHGIVVTESGHPAAAVLALVRAVPLLLVLDGLEVVQEGPAGDVFGRLLDGTLREVLTGACQLRHGGLVVLTSRFPFADLETFDGGTARMLEVPQFTPAEGSKLLAAAGGDWLPDGERRDLVTAVDGHALAVSVLAGLLAEHPPATDLAALRADLDVATRTDARVGKVLSFYAGRLAEPDRYLLAAVSLFARPVEAGAVLAVTAHEAFGGRLAGWTPAMVETVVRDRLGGLASWHPDGTISAHPLVRDTFRPLVMDAAEAAADTTLEGMPRGTVTSRADAQRMIEAIELLLDADHWQPANNVYQSRVLFDTWQHVAAPRLGQRAASAFVATPGRHHACATNLGADRLGVYLTDAGVYTADAGDLVIALNYLNMAVNHYRKAGEMVNLSRVLRYMADSLGFLGEIGAARKAAAEALECARRSTRQHEIYCSQAHLGWLVGLAGDTVEADQHFAVADQLEITDNLNREHLIAVRGTLWGEWLVRTGRSGPAKVLTTRNRNICRRRGWIADVAFCDRLLGWLALTTGNTAEAAQHLADAIKCWRDGDYLVNLAVALGDAAEHARAIGDLDAAERHATEAIAIAAPRGLAPAQSTALAARARIAASQEPASLDYIAQGRDAADAALRLAVRHHLPWHELDAVRAHEALDQTEGVDRGWAAKAGALHTRLVPPDLDPDPLATVERLVAEQKAAEAGGDGG